MESFLDCVDEETGERSRNWYILKGYKVFFYRFPNDTETLGEILLRDAEIISYKRDDPRFSLRLEDGRILTFRANGPRLKRFWVQCIRENLAIMSGEMEQRIIALKRKMDYLENADRIALHMSFLKKGGSLYKYSFNKRTHPKLRAFRLSPDETMIEYGSGYKKNILVRRIRTLRIGARTTNVQSYDVEKPGRCFSLIIRDRTFDLEALSDEDAIDWIMALQSLLLSNLKRRINHRFFTEVDLREFQKARRTSVYAFGSSSGNGNASSIHRGNLYPASDTEESEDDPNWVSSDEEQSGTDTNATSAPPIGVDHTPSTYISPAAAAVSHSAGASVATLRRKASMLSRRSRGMSLPLRSTAEALRDFELIEKKRERRSSVMKSSPKVAPPVFSAEAEHAHEPETNVPFESHDEEYSDLLRKSVDCTDRGSLEAHFLSSAIRNLGAHELDTASSSQSSVRESYDIDDDSVVLDIPRLEKSASPVLPPPKVIPNIKDSKLITSSFSNSGSPDSGSNGIRDDSVDDLPVVPLPPMTENLPSDEEIEIDDGMLVPDAVNIHSLTHASTDATRELSSIPSDEPSMLKGRSKLRTNSILRAPSNSPSLEDREKATRKKRVSFGGVQFREVVSMMSQVDFSYEPTVEDVLQAHMEAMTGTYADD